MGPIGLVIYISMNSTHLNILIICTHVVNSNYDTFRNKCEIIKTLRNKCGKLISRIEFNRIAIINKCSYQQILFVLPLIICSCNLLFYKSYTAQRALRQINWQTNKIGIFLKGINHVQRIPRRNFYQGKYNVRILRNAKLRFK